MEKINDIATFSSLVSIEEIDQPEDVYDITVEDTHNFFANGVLAHNCQHLVNFYLMELAKETGLKLIVTVDSHYSNPNHWKEREVYKAMAWASKTKGTIDPNTLPQKVEELKCELYPKNADQLWDTYLEQKAAYPDLYTDDQLICDAIERTHDIAHNLIGDVSIDRSVKLPGIRRLIEKDRLEKLQERFAGMSEDDLAFKQLVQLALDGLRQRKHDNDERYIQRLKKELEDIKHLQSHSQIRFAKYFLTYHKIMEIAGKEMLIGNGRGSAAGSILAYVLNITQVDPIRFGLLWERFLTRKKLSAPDIDSDFSDRDRAVKLLIGFFGSENVIPVTNFAQLQLRSLIKDVARLHNLPFEEINAATGKIEKEVLDVAKQAEGFDRGTWVMTFEAAMNDSPTFQQLMETYPEFQTTIKVLFKQMRGCFTNRVQILTNNGYKTVTELAKSDSVAFVNQNSEICYNQNYTIIHKGIKQVYAVSLENGTTLELTEDHEVMTQEGYKSVKDLTENDFIFTV